ncbi:MAG: hypothetical protein GY749_19640 [Desulfobacteraceae bacterium]|nr:hypothetical protein [Desulfobacteraceae bacterium]
MGFSITCAALPYYDLSAYLYFEDRKNPYKTRAIAMRELPNFLYAVYGALKADKDWSIKFADYNGSIS